MQWDIGKEKNTTVPKALRVTRYRWFWQKIFNTAYDTVLKQQKLAEPDLKGAAEESLNSVVDSVKEKSGQC